jgi:hypothetical protein
MPAAGCHMKHRLGEPHGVGSRRSPRPDPKRLVEVSRVQFARARRAGRKAAERFTARWTTYRPPLREPLRPQVGLRGGRVCELRREADAPEQTYERHCRTTRWRRPLVPGRIVVVGRAVDVLDIRITADALVGGVGPILGYLSSEAFIRKVEVPIAGMPLIIGLGVAAKGDALSPLLLGVAVGVVAVQPGLLTLKADL